MLYEAKLHQAEKLSALNALQERSTIVADTGDVEMIQAFSPQDATTNPSLLLAVIKSRPDLIAAACDQAKPDATPDDIADILTAVLTNEILASVPGFVSMEVPAKLSFDTEATVEKALLLLQILEELGAETDRVLIKVAATWEGIAAVKYLEAQGIKCNVTLVFSLSQAALAAESNAFLISPFVGRILDWKVRHGFYDYESGDPDPGVEAVNCIRNYFAKYDIKTIIMAASFRSTQQVLALAGTDKLTISPALLQKLELQIAPEHLGQTISTDQIKPLERCDVSEAGFRHDINNDRMASNLLSDGIRRFEKDAEQLNVVIQNFMKV